MRLGSVTLIALFVVAVAVGADWPQWRGPNRDGISGDKGLLQEWPKGGPKLLWSVKDSKAIGIGYGQPAVVGDKLFIIGADGGSELVTCLNVKDGTKVWQKKLTTSAGKYNTGWGGGPRSTPTVDGDRLYVLGVTGDLVCLGTDKGEVKWQKNLVKDFDGAIPNWGYSESPLIDGDHLVCTPGSDGGMVALDKTTGKPVWSSKDVKGRAGYSSIMPVDVSGVRVYVQQNMSSALVVRAKDGKQLWKGGKIGRRTAVIPSPVVQDNYVFFTAGYGAGCECYKLEKDGDGVKVSEVYVSSALSNKHGGVVRVGDYVYGFNGEASGSWVCLNLKKGGEPAWRAKGVGMGSISVADGYLYCYAQSDGTLARAKATDKGYEEAGKLKIPQTSKLRPNQGKVWAHPVIANDKLFLRDFELLFVYDLSK